MKSLLVCVLMVAALAEAKHFGKFGAHFGTFHVGSKYSAPPVIYQPIAPPPVVHQRYGVPPVVHDHYGVPPVVHDHYGVPPVVHKTYGVPPVVHDHYGVPPQVPVYRGYSFDSDVIEAPVSHVEVGTTHTGYDYSAPSSSYRF